MESLGGKYSGILINKLKNGQITFYIQYRDELGKPKKERVGKSPEMTKTKALNLLNERKTQIRELKDNIKKGTNKAFSIRKEKVEDNLYTLNDLADFYFSDNKVRTVKEMQFRYNFHIRNEDFANLPIISLIANPERTEDILKEFIDRKLEQRSDKRRNVVKNKDLSIEDKELQEIERNNKEIKALRAFAQENPKKHWRELNKAKYLEKKNQILELRRNEPLKKKLLDDPLIPTTEKRLMLGLLSYKTIKEIQNLCITIVNYAIEEKRLGIINPFTIFNKRRFNLKLDNVRDRYMTKEEIKVFLEEIKHIKETYPHKYNDIYLMCVLSLTIAARQSTLLSIKVGDIDLENNKIRLRNHKETKSYVGHIALEEINQEIKELIKGREPSDYLFLNREGTKRHRIPRKVQEVLDYTVNYKREWTEWLSIKDFRNTVASHLVMRGTPIEQVSKVLDHADITITQRYSRLSKNTAKNEITSMIEDFLS